MAFPLVAGSAPSLAAVPPLRREQGEAARRAADLAPQEIIADPEDLPALAGHFDGHGSRLRGIEIRGRSPRRANLNRGRGPRPQGRPPNSLVHVPRTSGQPPGAGRPGRPGPASRTRAVPATNEGDPGERPGDQGGPEAPPPAVEVGPVRLDGRPRRRQRRPRSAPGPTSRDPTTRHRDASALDAPTARERPPPRRRHEPGHLDDTELSMRSQATPRGIPGGF